MQNLFQIILAKHPSTSFDMYLDIYKNLIIKIEVIKDHKGFLKSSIEIPISNLDDDSFDWSTIANILLSTLE
jgi:hypothetical protein